MVGGSSLNYIIAMLFRRSDVKQFAVAPNCCFNKCCSIYKY